MMQIIAEHLQEPCRNNLFLLGYCIFMESMKKFMEISSKIGKYNFSYSEINSGLDLEIIRKNDDLFITLKQDFDEVILTVEHLRKKYEFLNGRIVKYMNHKLYIHWNEEGKIYNISFGHEKVFCNINDTEEDIKRFYYVYLVYIKLIIILNIFNQSMILCITRMNFIINMDIDINYIMMMTEV